MITTITNGAKMPDNFNLAIEEFISDGNLENLLCTFGKSQAIFTNYAITAVNFIFTEDGQKKHVIGSFNAAFGKLSSHCVATFMSAQKADAPNIWMRSVMTFFNGHDNRINLTASKFNQIAIIKPVLLRSVFAWALGIRKAVEKYSLDADGTVCSDEYDRHLTSDIIIPDHTSMLFMPGFPGKIRYDIAEIEYGVDILVSCFEKIVFGIESCNKPTTLNDAIVRANVIAKLVTNITKLHQR